ncbi:uncharacterized protein LOC123290610 [Chrysoperla carnea]|uniref:uncharacterized protein LOC123290610 n=1 Tax=Chrysoperla carnea TaxID=189513 RepID=UPI001D060D60|nr:uncharacterized protein LOC123290610 [Chrysoperla carnea]
MVGRWDRQLAHDFVKKYIELDVLWNTDNPLRKSPKARKKAYGILQQLVQQYEPNFSVADVCNKIKGFRSTYLMELKKIQNSKNQAYVPTLSWFPIMDNALHTPVMDNLVRRYGDQIIRTKMNYKPAKRMKINHKDEEKNPLSEEYDSSMIKIENEEIIETYTPVNIRIIEDEEFHSSETSNEPKNNTTHQQYRQQQASTSSQNTTPQTSTNQNITPKTLKSIYEDNDDEFDIFGKSVAIQLRKLPLNQALKAQLDIQTLLINARLKANKGNEGNGSTSNASISSIIDSTTKNNINFSH